VGFHKQGGLSCARRRKKRCAEKSGNSGGTIESPEWEIGKVAEEAGV